MDTQNHREKQSQDTTDSVDLSELIKGATRQAHERAENTALMLRFQKGQITLPEHKLLLCCLYTVYTALEEELDRNASHPSVAPVHFPAELSRVAALEADLQYHLGLGWRERVAKPPAAALRYAQRLREVGKDHPELLVAHSYTRYLGDLSGGQVLGKMAQKALGLPGGEGAGLDFFSFPGVTNATRFKQLYRSRMNSLELSPAHKQAVTQEANTAFTLNIELFEELEKMVRSAQGQDTTDSVDLSELIKGATRQAHERAENTALMLRFQKGQITLPEHKLLLCCLYTVYTALEEELDRNASHPSVAPVHFPAELSRVAALEADLQYHLGPGWRERVAKPPAAALRYAQRLREVGKDHPELLVAHSYTRYLGDLSGGQVLGKMAQKALGLPGGEGAGLDFFSFPGVTNATRFKQLYRSRMNSLELSPAHKQAVTQEANTAFTLNIELFEELEKMVRSAQGQDTTDSVDLSELIKGATRQAHERAENTALMLRFQKGQITLPEHKLLLCCLYTVYTALEEELDRNASHPSVAPVHFPAELSRVAALEADLQYHLGPGWRERVAKPPAAALRYAQRLREVGKDHPELLVAHSYTRYLGDLSGGQVLGKMAQKALGLPGGEGAGLDFFSFPGVTNATRFKQLYRSRMNSLELSPSHKQAVTQEANTAFTLNIELFEDLEKMVGSAEAQKEVKSERGSEREQHIRYRASSNTHGNQSGVKKLQTPPPSGLLGTFPALRLVLGLGVAAAAFAVGLYML